MTDTTERAVTHDSAGADTVMPDHGGADAGVRVKPLEWHQHPDGETKRYEGVSAIGNNYAVFQAWWGAQNKWGWIGDGEFYHSEVEARQACNADYERRVLSAISHQPAAAEINASAEARLREALRDLVWLVSTDRTYDDSESLRSARNILFAENKAAMAALSAHPNASDYREEEARCTCGAGHGSLEGHTDWCDWVDASDCDKQGPIPYGYGEYTPITVGGSTSDRTADVTVKVRSAINGIYGLRFCQFSGWHQEDSIEKAIKKIVAIVEEPRP